MENQKPGNGNCSCGIDRVQGNQPPRLERKGGLCKCGEGCKCGGGCGCGTRPK